MQTIIFSGHKRKIAEFAAKTLNFAHESGGLLVTAEGEMLFQDTMAVENMLNADAPIHVTILKDGETVIDQSFRVTVFAFELDKLAVLL